MLNRENIEFLVEREEEFKILNDALDEINKENIGLTGIIKLYVKKWGTKEKNILIIPQNGAYISKISPGNNPAVKITAAGTQGIEATIGDYNFTILYSPQKSFSEAISIY